MFNILELIEEISTFIKLVIKFPLRIICKFKGHDFIYHVGFLCLNISIHLLVKDVVLELKVI